VDDRLLRYQEPSTPPPHTGFSRYGMVATAAAVIAVSLVGYLGTRQRVPETLAFLILGFIAFCAGVAFFGCILAAMDRRNWRTLMWLGFSIAAAAVLVFGASTAGYFHF